MEKRTCKLCFKSFANGRALGGHMRSHMLSLQPQPKTQQIQQLGNYETESASSTSPSSSSSPEEEEVEEVEEEEEEEEGKSLFYGLRENPKKSFRLVDPEFSFMVEAGSVVVQDRESETESSKNPTRKRSKRNRQQQQSELKKPKLNKPSSAELPTDPEPVSSVSDTTPEEDVALCLMMLSRDVWMRDEEEGEKSIEETDNSSELKSFPTRTRGKYQYQCGTCKKVFRSYQALGGHRASHKKIKLCNPASSSVHRTHEAVSKLANVATPVVDRRIHECPVCFRIFGSGQALGGHKRSHISGSASVTINSTKFGDNLIDLNLPAPVDEEDISQVELSAVSDGEFVDPIRR